jgi:hypothetical protein
MTPQSPDLNAVARAILDANLYMTLGTADADGRPWASPVFFAADRYRDLYLEVYPGERGLRAGARTMTPDQVVAPAPYRPFHAKVTEHWVLDPAASPGQRVPVTP